MHFLIKALKGLKPTLSGVSIWGLVLLILFSSGLYIYLAATQPHTGHEHIPENRFGEIGIENDGQLHAESNGVFYYYLERLLQQQGVTSTLALRSMSIASGLGAIVVVYLCGHILGGSRLGLISAWLLAINSTHLALAVHNRFFALNELFCALATLCLLQACRKERWTWWLAYALSIVLCISTMILSAALLVCHGFILLLLPNQRRSWIAFTLVGLLGISVFAWLVIRDPLATQRFEYGTTVSLSWYVDCWLHNNYTLTYQSAPLVDTVHKFRQYPLTLNMAFALLLVTTAILSLKNKADRRAKAIAGLWISWIFISLVILGYSAYVKNILNNSNLSWLIPCFVLVIAWAASRYRLLLYFLAIALLLNPLDCMGTYAFPGNNNIADKFVARHLHKNDIVLLDSSYPINGSQSPLLPLIATKKYEGPDGFEFESICADNATISERVVLENKERLRHRLRQLDYSNIIKFGRIWIVYVNDSRRRNEPLRPGDLFIPELKNVQKYVIVHNIPVSEWETHLLVLTPRR